VILTPREELNFDINVHERAKQKGPPGTERAFLHLHAETRQGLGVESALFCWSRRKSFLPAAGFRLWLGFWRLLDFFSAFIFASHG